MKSVKALAAGAVAAAVLTGCGGSPADPSTPAATGSAGTASPVASPVVNQAIEHLTATAAKSAAVRYFALYGAGQYASVYPMILPSLRAQFTRAVWVGVHTRCAKPGSADLTYKVDRPVVAGPVAFMSVRSIGAAASPASEQVTFTYSKGSWYYTPSDLSVYAHHDLAQAVAAAKAGGFC